jgi:hypothetical protein
MAKTLKSKHKMVLIRTYKIKKGERDYVGEM